MGADMRDTAVVILAAGQGTRMESDRAKVLHRLAGRPMLAYPLAAAEALDPTRLVVVVGRDADEVCASFAGRASFVRQLEQRGTGHAVLHAQPELEDFRGQLFILYGDTPLLRPETLRRMTALKAESGADLVLLSAAVDVPGIVLRDAEGRVTRVIEGPDATPEQLAVEERNTGVYLVDSELLWKTLAQVDDHNEQGELYLTDIVELALREGRRVEALRLGEPEEGLGVNTRAQFAEAGASLHRRIAERLMASGVTIVDPSHTYIDADVEVGPDTHIEPGCVIQGQTRIGRGVHLKPHCVIETSEVGDEVVMGPAAHLRTGTVLGRGVRIGNFVEVKNSTLGDGVKADHLSYIGDADVGPGASFGCGSIVVNYDGLAKHRTSVGEGAFIGCNVNLIAPVRIARNSFVAAGSTITKDVPEFALAVARPRQSHVEGWVGRRRGRSAGASEARAAGGAARKKTAGKKVAGKRARGAAKKTAARKGKTARRRGPKRPH